MEQGWKILIGLGAGTGLVFILRWYWWRINAWSEISAMVASFVDRGHSATCWASTPPTPRAATTPWRCSSRSRVTTVVWLTVTLLTPPESDADARRLLPPGPAGGPGLAPGGRAAGLRRTTRFPGGALSWVNWVAGVVAVYSAVFAVGAFLTGRPLAGGLVYGAVAVVAFLLIQRNLRDDRSARRRVDTADSPG